VSSERETFRTVSPRAGYGGDVLRVTVDKGRLTSVTGDKDDRHSRGHLSEFAKRYLERVYSDQRITGPLKRRGDPGSDDFEPISWDDALDEIANAIADVAAERDPRALCYYTGTGHDGVMTQFGPLLLGYTGGYSTFYGDLCNAAGLEAIRLTFGRLACHPPEQYADSKLIVIWGKNPAVTHPQQWAFLAEARKRGTKLLCIDPIRTKTAQACDEHIAPRPGTDGFFANAVAHVILNENLHDKTFVKKHVHGFDDYHRLIRNCSPRKAEEICDLEATAIEAFAREYAGAKPAHVSIGYGVQRYRNGGQTVRAIGGLAAIAGHVGVRGGGCDYINQAAFVTRPFPFRMPAPPRIRQLGPRSRFGRVVLGAKDPPVLAAIVERANPMAQTPFASAVHYALTRLQFVCVIDQFLTDTARRAHIVLPAKSMFEELDVCAGPWDGVLRLTPKCIAPPGDVRTEREIYRGIAERLGYPTEQFDLAPEEMINRVLPPGLSVARLKKQAFVRHAVDHVPFGDKKFGTHSGKVELRCEAAEISWRVDPVPFYAPPRESEQGDLERFKRFPLRLLTPKSEDRLLSQWAHDETITERGTTTARIHPDDAKSRRLESGVPVRVFNDRGEITLPVEIDANVRAGVVVVPQGRWIALDGFSVNVLTHDDITDMGYGAIYFDCLVEVERAPPKT